MFYRFTSVRAYRMKLQSDVLLRKWDVISLTPRYIRDFSSLFVVIWRIYSIIIISSISSIKDIWKWIFLVLLFFFFLLKIIKLWLFWDLIFFNIKRQQLGVRRVINGLLFCCVAQMNVISSALSHSWLFSIDDKNRIAHTTRFIRFFPRR